MTLYLAVGSCVIESGEEPTDYFLTGKPSFPEPAPDGYGGHVPAVRSFDVWVTGTDTADMNDNVALLRREGVRDNYLYFRHGASGDVLSCRMRECKVQEATYNPSAREGIGVLLSVTATTDPYWLGAWSAETNASGELTYIPGHIDASGITGEVDALLSIRACPSASGTLLAIGVKADPDTLYSYLDDYSGTADANALNSAKATLTASAGGAVVGSPPNVDTNANRGRSLLLARVDASACTNAATYQGATTITGNGVSSSVTVYEGSGSLSASALTGVELGDVTIPCAQVPDVSIGNLGWGSSSAFYENTTASAMRDLSASSITHVGQSFTASGDMRVTGFTFKASASTPAGVAGTLYQASGDVPVGSGLASGTAYITASGEFTVTFHIPYMLSSGDPACIVVWDTNRAFDPYYSTVGSWAGGKMSTCVGGVWAAEANNDLYFKLLASTPVGFNTTNPVYAAQGSATTIGLDYVQRVPVDYAAVVYRRSASGDLAIWYDGDTDTPYLSNASGGIGNAVFDLCEIRRPLRLKPGVNNRIVFGVIQADASANGFMSGGIEWAYRPRYLTATG